MSADKVMKTVPQKYLKYMSYALHLIKKVVKPEDLNVIAIDLFMMNESAEIAVKSVEDVLSNPMQTEMNELKALKKSLSKKAPKERKALTASIVDSAENTEYVYAEDPKALEKAAKKEAREAEQAAKKAEQAAKKEAREAEQAAKKEAREAEQAAKKAEQAAKKAEQAAKKEAKAAMLKASSTPTAEEVAELFGPDEIAIEAQAPVVSNDDIMVLNNIIEKHSITLPDKLPADYANKSVLDAYLLAKSKTEAQMKPAEKKLIRDVIKALEKDEKAAAKEAEKAAKKKVVTPEPVLDKEAKKAADKAAKETEKAAKEAAKEAEKAAKELLKAQEKAAKEQLAQQKKVIKSLKQGKIEVPVSELTADAHV